MQTVQPCVTIGSYVWAQDRLPYDEFTLRLDELRAAMERNGWPAVLVYGDVREHSALAFLRASFRACAGAWRCCRAPATRGSCAP